MKYKKITILSVIIFAVILILISLFNSTSALFATKDYGTNNNYYSTGMLDIEAVSKSENISLGNALPMSDDDGKLSNPYVFTIKNVGNLDYKFDVKLLSTGTSETTFSSQYIKLQIDDGEVITLASLTGGVIKDDITLYVGESIDISIRIWLDYNTPNSEMGKIFNSKIVTDGQAIATSTNHEYGTLLSNFEYFLGSEYPVVNVLEENYYDQSTGETYNIMTGGISLEPNEILLTKYIGDSTDVVVPNTYTIGDITYNVVMLSLNLFNSGSDGITVTQGIFYNNKNIKSVFLSKNIKIIYSINDGNTSSSSDYDTIHTSGTKILDNCAYKMFYGCTSLESVSSIPDSVTDIGYTFYGCTNLVDVPVIPKNVIDMIYTFAGCTSLVNTPVIPNFVTNMTGTFSGCKSLVNAPAIPNFVTNMSVTFAGCTSLVNAPVIPNSVTNMTGTFNGCKSLVNAPAIPNSVISMNGTFNGCTSLVNAPAIPNSVTSMNGTFNGCFNLTGTVRINARNILTVTNIFAGTSKAITVEVPANSTTFTKLSGLTASNGKPSNVTLVKF